MGESLLEEAIAMAASNGLVKPHDHVVAVSLTASREAMVKVGRLSVAVLFLPFGGGLVKPYDHVVAALLPPSRGAPPKVSPFHSRNCH